MFGDKLCFSAGIILHLRVFFCGKQPLTRLSLSREVYGSYPPLSEANISHLHVIVWREVNGRILGAGKGRLKLVCYCLVGGKRTSPPPHTRLFTTELKQSSYWQLYEIQRNWYLLFYVLFVESK